MNAYVIRRARPVESSKQALTFVVRYRFAGRIVNAGSYRCPHTAQAEARALRRSEHLDAWVSRIAA